MKYFVLSLVLLINGCAVMGDTFSNQRETQRVCDENNTVFQCSIIQAYATQARVVKSIDQSVAIGRIDAEQGQNALDHAIKLRQKIDQVRALGETHAAKVDLNDATSVLLSIEQFLLTTEE